MLILPDVSFWQDDPTTLQVIDYNAMAERTIAVIIRAGQNLWADNEFVISWENAKKAGLLRGAYWFYDSRADPKQQAQLWIATLNGDLGELPLWCDFEDQYGGAYGTWSHWYDFIEELKKLAPGKKIGIYTGYYYWLEKTASASPASKDYFGQYPLWIARYNATEPLVPYPWEDWTLWQYTDNGDGTSYGVESRNIDLNYFNGDEVKFKETFGLIDWIPDDEQENNQMTTYSMTPISSRTRMRVDHNTYADVIDVDPIAANVQSFNMGDLLKGDDIWVAPADGDEVKKGDTWLHVTHRNGAALKVSGWTALTHKGYPICKNFTVIGEPPPPPPPPEPIPFPDEFTLTNHDGSKARFIFDRIIE